jgi:hypothetical protein
VAENFLDPNRSAVVRAMQQDSGYHCNIGIANLSAAPRTYAVHVSGDSGSTDFTVSVPAYSLIQTAIPPGVFSVLDLIITPQGPGTGFWAAYGSSVDNITGDAWSNKAFPL